ncbi:MAG: hypothetical protein HDS26_05905 [Bacteroides sp.]|nr:hypothetical protein [Bacteroides sp.]
MLRKWNKGSESFCNWKGISL